MAGKMVTTCGILLVACLLPTAQYQLPICNVATDILDEYNCTVNVLIPVVEEGFHEPWSHYLTPLNDQLMAVRFFGLHIVDRLLSLEDGRCQARYDLDQRDFIPKRLIKYTQEAQNCDEGIDCVIYDPAIQTPTEVTYICLNEDNRPTGASKTCLEYCNGVPRSGMISSNKEGTQYIGGIFHMYIMGVQASQHSNSHNSRLTINFTRFSLEPPADDRDCGFNGDYLEIFDLATLQYLTLCGTAGEGLVINTTSSLYVTFHSRRNSTAGLGFEFVYTLEPYHTINPGFRNVELASYVTPLQCNDTLLHRPLLTHAYLIDQHLRQDSFSPGNYYIHSYNYHMLNQQRGVITPIHDPMNLCGLSFQTMWYESLKNVEEEFQTLLALRVTHANITERVLKEMGVSSAGAPEAGLGVIGRLGSQGVEFATVLPDVVNRLEHVNMFVRNNYDDCSKGWNYYSHHCYYFLDVPLSFPDAQSRCRDMQAQLVTWNHVAYSKIFTTCPFELDEKSFWLGAFKDSEDVWVYSIDSSTVNFPPPLADGFDDEDFTKRCVVAEYNAPDYEYYWLNEDCDAKHASVCVRDVGHLVVGEKVEEMDKTSVVEYNIELPSMYTALIEFKQLNFIDNKCLDMATCHCQSHVLVTGDTMGSSGTICKTSEELPIVLTKSSQASIKSYGPHASFSAMVNPVFSECGGVLHSSYQGYVSASGTPSNTNCIYTIGYSRRPAPNALESYAHGVHVQVELVSLPAMDNCTGTVVLYDGIDTSAPLLWKGCSSGPTAKFVSTSPVIVIVFQSGPSGNAHFLAKYKIGCDVVRPPSEMEEVIMPGMPKWWSVPGLMCTIKLNLPKRPYVSFGASCRDFGKKLDLLNGTSLTCYGTNQDMSTHVPRQFVSSDDYLFNADTKYVDAVWYFHVGSESMSHVQELNQLSITVRPKGKLELVLFMRLNGTFKDFSKYNHQPFYNQAVDLEPVFSLNDPWQRDGQKALTVTTDLQLRVPLDPPSPIPSLSTFTFVFWIYAPNCDQRNQSLFWFTSTRDRQKYQLLSLDECSLSITRDQKYVMKLDFLSNYAADNPYHTSKWRKVAIGWRDGDRELWTYVDGQFRRRARYTEQYFSHVLTDYELLAIGGTDQQMFLDPLNGSVACLQMYANSLSLTEIEEAHGKCAPEVVSDFFLPLTDSLMELNSVQRFPNIKEDVSPPPPTLIIGPQANASHWSEGMLFVNGSGVVYRDVSGDGTVSSWSVMFWLSVQGTADQSIMTMSVNGSAYLSIRVLLSGHLVVDGSVIESSSLVPFRADEWQLVAVTVDIFTEKYTIWIDEYKVTSGATSPGVSPIAQNSLDVELGPASGFALSCLQIFYWKLYQVDLVKAQKVCETKPSIARKQDCDPGWTWVHRVSSEENYCVRNVGKATSSTEAIEKCDDLNASPLLFGDMETMFSSSFLVSPVWGGIWSGISFTDNNTFESLHPDQRGVTWLWRSDLWLSPKYDEGYSESACELLTRGMNVVNPCNNSMDVSSLTSGPLVTRNTPSFENNRAKVPHLLYPSTSVSTFDVICARRNETGIELPLGVCHRFTDTATVARQYYSTGLYVPQFFIVKVTITDVGYMTCPNKPSVIPSTLDFCSSPPTGNVWLKSHPEEVISQPIAIEDSWRYQISYYKDTERPQFDLLLQAYFIGYGTGHPRYDNSAVRIVEDPTDSEIKYLFSKGYPQVVVDEEWRNYCVEDYRMVEWFCQQATGFRCISVSYGRIETTLQMNSVNSSGHLSSYCSPTQAMWISCRKCYNGYTVVSAPTNRIASPGYHRRAYQRNMFREYDISGQDMDISSETMLAVKFEHTPSIDCQRGDELYAVTIAHKNISIANVEWSHCKNASTANVVRIPSGSMIVFRSSNQSEEGEGFAAEVFKVCSNDEEKTLTAFSATDFLLALPDEERYECTRTYLLADKNLVLFVKSLINGSMSASCCTITIGHGEEKEENILLTVEKDLDRIYRNFTGYTKYWISYKQHVQQSCDQQETAEASMRSIMLELQVVYYYKVRNRPSGQLSPPDFMFKSAGELKRDQIAIWLIEMLGKNQMYRLDFILSKFGIPCGDEKVGRSWIRLAYTNASSLTDIYAIGSLSSHNFTDYYVCDDDVDSNARPSDSVHWYPDWPQVSCDGNLLVMLMIEPGQLPVKGFSAIFHQFDIGMSTACSGSAIERTESPAFYGETVSAPYYPQEMPPNLHYQYIFHTVSDSLYRLEGLLVSQCRFVEMVASLPATGETLDLCEEFKVEGDTMLLSGAGPLVINVTSSERTPPVPRLVLNTLSNGPRVRINFHKVLDEKECYSTDSNGYPTTFTRKVAPQFFQKMTLQVTAPPCGTPCCHLFSYGSDDVIDKTTPYIACNTTAPPTTFYAQNLWGRLNVDDSLPVDDRLVVLACFLQLAFVEKTEFHATLSSHLLESNEYRETVYYISVPAPLRIRLRFLHDVSMCTGVCCHRVLVGEGHPTSALNKPLTGDPVCWSDVTQVMWSSANEISLLVQSESGVDSLGGAVIEYKTFIECSNVTLDESVSQLIYWDKTIGSCEMVVRAPQFIQLELMLEDINLPDGEVTLVVRNYYTSQIYLNVQLQADVPVAFTFPTDRIIVSFQPLLNSRRRRQVLPSVSFQPAFILFTPSTTACYTELVLSRGVIFSYNFETGGFYEPDTLCVWTLPAITAPFTTYRLTFKSLFEVSRTPMGRCADYILILQEDGTPVTAPLCGLTPPADIYVASAVTVVFFSDSSVEMRGWSLVYHLTTLDVTSDLSGVITSPLYPADYPANSAQENGIVMPQGYRVHLFLADMDIQKCNPCFMCDYLSIQLTDAHNVSEALCGQNPSTPPEFWSMEETASVIFSSNNRNEGRGFKLIYHAFRDCDVLLTDLVGFFTSPGYKHGGMRAATDCFYVISAPKHHRVVLTYTAELSSDLCQGECCSYITVRDGEYKLSPSGHGKQCGSIARRNVISASEDMRVQLSVAEGRDPLTSHGFNAMYITYKSYFTELTGTIKLPDALNIFGDLYMSNLYFEWYIEVDINYSLRLDIIGPVDLQPVRPFCQDKLEVYQRAYGELNLSLSHDSSYFCANRTSFPPIYTSYNVMKIVFTSNPWNGATGFRELRYVTLPKLFKDIGGVIESLPLPQLLEDDNHQEYFISLPVEYYIDIHFIDWKDVNCNSSSISVGEGKEVGVFTYFNYENYCDTIPTPIYSLMNNIWIRFFQKAEHPSSDWSIGSFALNYQGELRVRTTPGTIKSPGHPHHYPEHLARSWIIKALKGHVIRLEVVYVDMPEPDYLLIGDGVHPHEQVIARYNAPVYSPVYSTLSDMWIFFYSHEDNQTADGFMLMYTFEQRELHYPAAVFGSPVDPTGYYVLGFTGWWNVTVRDGRKIEVNLIIDLPDMLGCVSASLTVTGFNSSLQMDCGVAVVKGLITRDNTFSVSLRTDSDVFIRDAHTGFEVSYQYIPLPGDGHFEDTLNGYMNVDSLKWEIGEGLSAVSGTGQKEDNRFVHTGAAHVGDKYLIVRAAGHYYGEKASIVTPVLHKGAKRLTFDYLMRGKEVGTLRVLQAPCTSEGKLLLEPIPLWSRTGHQSDGWLQAVDIPASGNTTFYVLIFEAILGSGANVGSLPITEGDILIDDIYLDPLEYESCEGDDGSYCHNGGVCMELSKSYDVRGYGCLCYHGYYGAHCEHELLDCEPDTCSGHGTCYETGTFSHSYWCSCESGYTGQRCQLDINECADTSNALTQCSTHGTCIDGVNEFSCDCFEDFYGEYCQHQYLPCETRDNPCGDVDSRGHCIDLEGIDNYRCACNFKYTGEHCEVLSYDFCADGPCNKTDSRAVCINAMSSHFCVCSPGHYGPGCNVKVDYCKGVTCHFGGFCVDGEYNFTCQCRSGYTGKLCERRNDGCDSNACDTAGTRWCQSEDSHNYTCVCRMGYRGDYCEELEDYCISSPCLNRATCLPTYLDYVCVCPPGYTGELCEDEVDVCQSRPCINNGGCAANADGSFNCTCSELYEGARCERRKRLCHDSYCDSAGTCHETLEGAICHCRHDYTGERCETRVDNCVDHKCAEGSTCIDSVLSYLCRCPAGRFGLLCNEQVDPCNNNGCIHGTCESSVLEDDEQMYQCRCYPGFTGAYCEEQVDECRSHPCAVGSTCYDDVNGYVCVCSAGHYGSKCQHKVDYCTSHNCSDNSVCISGTASFTCHCHPGYSGRYCEEEIDECLPAPCYGGNCTDLVDGYRCDCNAGWGGTRCSVRLGFCEENTCGPNGVCLEAHNTYHCKCDEGYIGEHCEVKQTGFCATVWCGPNAYCQELDYGFVCRCQSFWTGPDCSLPVGCNPSPCSTKGSCMVVGGSGVCVCEPNWTGRTCREPVDSCQDYPCSEHGVCHNLLDGEYMCQCKLGTSGPNCVDSIDNCDGVECENGGTCKDQVNNFRCHCLGGYAGKFCELKLAEAVNLGKDDNQYVSSILDGSAEVNSQDVATGLQAIARSSECDFGHSSESMVYIISNAVGLLLLTMTCIVISRAHLSKHKCRRRDVRATQKSYLSQRSH